MPSRREIWILVLLFCWNTSTAQLLVDVDDQDSLMQVEAKPVPIYSKEYLRQYKRYKRIILKVYPYALYASDVLYQLEADSEGISRTGKRKRFYKRAYKDLKEDFKYVFLDLYTSEGKMLMKLVHRETGMTVYDIAEKYRGKKSATLFSLMGKIWDQDVRIKFDPLDTDKIAEHVLRDIEDGIIPFRNNLVKVNREQYKENQKAHKKRLKDYKKQIKENRKKNKKEKKRARRANPEN